MNWRVRLDRLPLRLTVIALSAVAAAAPLEAQHGRGPAGRGGGPPLLRDSLSEAGPIELLLARRDTFQLGVAQVQSLERLAAELRESNAVPIRELLELRREIRPLIGMHPRDMSAEQRATFTRQAARARPLMQQVQQNNLRAMEQVGAVLTEAQKRQVRRWLQESGGPQRGRGRNGRAQQGAPGP